jgi:hypothetical protein
VVVDLFRSKKVAIFFSDRSPLVAFNVKSYSQGHSARFPAACSERY